MIIKQYFKTYLFYIASTLKKYIKRNKEYVVDLTDAVARNRTAGLLITNQSLYQLSYNGKGLMRKLNENHAHGPIIARSILTKFYRLLFRKSIAMNQ